jgi:hypothetical protein
MSGVEAILRESIPTGMMVKEFSERPGNLIKKDLRGLGANGKKGTWLKMRPRYCDGERGAI